MGIASKKPKIKKFLHAVYVNDLSSHTKCAVIFQIFKNNYCFYIFY